MRIKKISVIALLLAVVTLCSACSTAAVKSTEEEARVVATCGDHEIRYEELRYLTMRYKADLADKYGKYIFDEASTGEAYEETIRALVTAALCKSYAAVDLCAAKDVTLSDKETKKEVQEYVDETVSYCGGKNGYLEYLASNFMTDSVFRFNAALLSCQYRYFDLLAAEIEKEAYDAVMAGEGFIRVRSIFIQNDEGESVSENRKMAETVVAAVRNGASVEDYIGTRYNQDTSECDYYFMRGYFIEAYEDAAFDLAVGEVSDVVEAGDGFYVIQRVEPDEGYFAANVDTLMSMYISCRMNGDATAIAESLEVIWNEYGESLALWSMK